jgi:hypothetical protein
MDSDSFCTSVSDDFGAPVHNQCFCCAKKELLLFTGHPNEEGLEQ